MVYHLKQLISGHATGTDLLEVPTIYKVYLRVSVRGDIPPISMGFIIWHRLAQYLHFTYLKWPLNWLMIQSWISSMNNLRPIRNS